MRKNEIREYLLNNEETLFDIVNELNSWNNCLDYLEFWENDEEFFNSFFDSPMEAVRATYYGDYNFNDDYVRFNGYGNVESFSEYDKDEEIIDSIDDIVDNLVEYYEYITIDDEDLENLLSDEEEEE